MLARANQTEAITGLNRFGSTMTIEDEWNIVHTDSAG